MNPLTALLLDQMIYFLRKLPQDRQLVPCELQICAYLLSPKLSVVCGSALWTGVALTGCSPFANAMLLTQSPRYKRYYVYAVTRSIDDGRALRYTYILPPDDVLTAVIGPSDDGSALLELDMSVVDYARLAANG